MGITIWGPGLNPALPVTLFYGGAEKLVFDRDCWVWFKCELDGSRSRVDGVTTVLKVIHKEALLPWGIKVCLGNMRRLLVEGRHVVTKDVQETFPLYEDALDEFIKTAKKTDSNILHDAGDVGTDAHAFLKTLESSRSKAMNQERSNCLPIFPLTSGPQVVLCRVWNSSTVTTFDSFTQSVQCTAVRSTVAGRWMHWSGRTPAPTPLVARNYSKIH